MASASNYGGMIMYGSRGCTSTRATLTLRTEETARMATRKSIIEKIQMYALPEPNSGCWLWMGNIGKAGYGTIFDVKVRRAHRVAYELFKGPIPDGLVLDHLCRVRCCVNPDHLEPVTDRENIKRGLATISAAQVAAWAKKLARTHCKWGHEFTEENTSRRDNYRLCRACKKLRNRMRFYH